MTALLNFAAMCCMVATFAYYMFNSPRSWRLKIPAATVLASSTVLTGTVAVSDVLGGSEYVIRIFYAGTCFFMAGIVSIFLTQAKQITFALAFAGVLATALLFSNLFIEGVIHNGVRWTRDPGEYYDIYLAVMLASVVAQVGLSVRRWRQCRDPGECVEWRIFAIASIPSHIIVTVLIVLMSQNMPVVTAADILHLAVFVFCAILVYASSGATLPAITLPHDKLRAAQQLSMAHITAVESLMARTELPAAMSVAMLTTITNQATAPWIRKTSMCVRGAVVQCIDLRSLAFCRRTRKAAQATFDTVKASGSLSPLYYDDSTSPPTPVFFR